MSELQLVVAATSDRFDADDDRWLSQVRLLHQDLSREGPLRMQAASGGLGGARGAGPQEVAVVVASGAVSGIVAIITTWLRLGRDRTVRVSWDEPDGNRRTFTVDATNVDNATLRSAIEHGLRTANGDGDSGDSGDSGDPSD